ncbi:glycosyltransferase family 87 protein [Verrucomicrobiota bacterium]
MPSVGDHNRRSLAFAVLAAAGVVHIAIVASVCLQHKPVIWHLHNDTIHRVGPGADLYAIYHAGINMRQGLNPYSKNDDHTTPYFYPFRYLPVVALAATVLRVFSPETALLVWIIVVETVLWWLIAVFWHRLHSIRMRTFAVTALLLSSPYFLELYMGQFTFVTITFVAFALLSGRLRVVTYTCACLLKAFPLAAGPALVRHRRYWPKLVVATTLVVVSSAPYFILRPDAWHAFYEANMRPFGGMHSGNYGFMHLLYLLIRDCGLSCVIFPWTITAAAVRWAALGGTALLVLFSKRDNAVLGVSALLLAHFISYVHVWEHHCSGIVVLGLLMLTVKYDRRWAVPLIVTSVVLLCLPTPFGVFDQAKNPALWDPAGGWPRYASYVVLLPKVIPTLALYVLCMTTLCRSGFTFPRKHLR